MHMELIFSFCNHHKILSFHLSFIWILVFIHLINGNDNDIKIKWSVLNYTWNDIHLYQDYYQNQKYIPSNCVVTGINVDKNDNIYVSVPRWTSGVPGTLNIVRKVDNNEYLLDPYPSWECQEEGELGKIQNAQSMTINTNDNIMWVLDVGRRNFLKGGVSNNTAPPTIWFIDLNTNQLLKDQTYVIPESCISYNDSFLNDIALDQDNNIAYLTDANGQGGIIVFDKAHQICRKYSGVSTENDPDYTMIINGVNYGNNIFTTPVDGIAITEDYKAIFYTQVQGTTLYRLSTDVLVMWLFDTSISNSVITDAVELVGDKLPSDGISYLSEWLYWGALTTSTIYFLKIGSTSKIDSSTMNDISYLKPNTNTMHWVDSFCIDVSKSNYLWYTSNKLDLFINNTMNFTNGDINFHIMRLDTKAEDPEIFPSDVVTMVIICIVIFVLFIVFTMITLIFYWRLEYLRRQKYELIYNINDSNDDYTITDQYHKNNNHNILGNTFVSNPIVGETRLSFTS